MRFLVPALACVVGCSFRTSTGSAPSDGAGGDAADAATDATIDTKPAFLCNATDPQLRACFTFDGDTMDRSGSQLATSAGNVGFTDGEDGMAAALGATSTLVVSPSTALDVTALTIRMWIRPNTIPVDPARGGLVDSGGRYRMFLLADGVIRCAITGGPDVKTGTGAIAAARWTRTSCTYDGNTMKIYVDGVMAGQLAQTATIPAAGTGMVIGENNPSGDNYDGAIDDLEIWDAILPP